MLQLLQLHEIVHLQSFTLILQLQYIREINLYFCMKFKRTSLGHRQVVSKEEPEVILELDVTWFKRGDINEPPTV